MQKKYLRIRIMKEAVNFQYAGSACGTLKTGTGCGKGKGRQIQNSMLNSFPSATSNKFGEALDEFKEYFNRKNSVGEYK